MKTRNVWRLANRPTSEDVVKLLNSGIITKDEAKEILFNVEEEAERDKKSLESEIKFLRELVEKLSKGSPTQIIETIRYVEKPYIQYPWYQPYVVWCGNTNIATGGNSATYAYTSSTMGTGTGTGSNNLVSALTSTSQNLSGVACGTGRKFSAIKTF